MNFSRKMILVAGAALLAACGDKVTVAAPTPPVTPVAKINSVEVAPLTATLSIGQTITMTAAVNADAGLATTVTWSSSDAGKASVSSAGVVTAVAATPGVAICAASTVDAGKKGCASIVVQAATAVQPASISIASITVAGNLNAPVNPTAVAGQIDITLNVNPGNQTVSKVVLLVGGIARDSQTFTAAQSAALRYAADQAVAAQTTFPQVIFSVNTAAFNPTTGAPTYKNITQAVSARLYTVQGGSTAAATATVATSLTFANVNTVAGGITVTGGQSAFDAAGYGWKSGAVTGSVIPVIYDGAAVGSVTMHIANTCDGSGSGARALAATAPAAGSYAYTATFNNSDAASAAGNVVSYEFNKAFVAGCGQFYTDGGVPVQADVFDANGNNIVTNKDLARVRLDNFAPPAPVFVANPGGRSGNWVNGTVTLAANDPANTPDGWLFAAPVDGGIGGAVAVMKVGADQATAIASTTTYTSTASMAPTVDAASQCVVLYAKDKLGNTSAAPAAAACGAAGGATQIVYGVDLQAPYISGIRSPSGSTTSTSRRTGANIGGNFNVVVLDTGAIGNSGMNSTNPVRATVKLRNVATAAGCIVADPATLLTTCAYADNANNAARVGTLGAVAVGEVVVTVTAETVNGYYTISAQAVDAAGNVSAAKTRVTVLDNVAPSVTTASLTNAGNANAGFSFTSLASDNLDLQNFRYFMNYGGAANTFFDVDPTAGVANPNGWREGIARTTINGYNAASFVNSNFQLAGSTNLPLALQSSVPGVFPAATVGVYAAADKLGFINSEVRDQGSVTLTTATGIAGAISSPATSTFTTGVSTATDITDYSFAMLNTDGVSGYNMQAFTACTGAYTRDAGAIGGCQAVSLPLVPEPSSISVRVQVTGATGALLQPFAKVYIVGSTGNTATSQLVTIGTLTTVNLLDNGATRRWRYDGTMTLDANTWDLVGGVSTALSGSNGPTQIRNIYVVGVDANGRVGLVSQAITVTFKE